MRLGETVGAAARFIPLSERQDWIALLLIALMPLALLLPGMGGVPYPNAEAAFSDMTISHLPYTETLRQSLVEERFPLWNANILSGAPFAANPLTGLWYPPGWPALMFNLPFGFNLMILIHLIWSGWGLYFLLRSEGLGLRAALFGAAAWVWLPKNWAHYGAGHVMMIYALAWTPWLLLFLSARQTTNPIHTARREHNTVQRVVRRFASRGYFGEAIVLALIFTADPRWAAYAGILWAAYGFFRMRKGAAVKEVLRLTGQVAIAGLLAAPLAAPMLEYVRLSTRSAMTAADWMAYSLPPARILGLLYPDWSGFHEYCVYIGQIVLALFFTAIVGSSRLSRRYWITAGAIAFLWALGDALPWLNSAAKLPGLNLLRVPSRALFIAGLASACLAAYAVDEILKGALRVQEVRRVRLMLVGLVGISLALTLGVFRITGALPTRYLWGSAALVLSAIWIALGLNGRIPKKAWFFGVVVVLGADLLAMNLSLFQRRPLEDVIARSRAVAQALALTPGSHRIYSPSYSVPQEAAALYDLELADGVDPLQLEAYAVFMEKATGVPRSGYSVSLPPMSAADPEDLADPAQVNTGDQPDADLLGLLNVGYVASEFAMNAPGLEFSSRVGETYIYRNHWARGHAWMQPAVSAVSPTRPAAVLKRIPEQIEVEAEGPGVLVVSEIAYPGWKATIDDQPVKIIAAFGLLRGVEVPSGMHRINFVFQPGSVYFGLALWFAGVLIMCTTALRMRSYQVEANE